MLARFRLLLSRGFMAQFTQADTDYTLGRSQDNSLLAVGAILAW